MKKETFSSKVLHIIALIILAPLIGVGIICSMVGEALRMFGGGLSGWCNNRLYSVGAPGVRRVVRKSTVSKAKSQRVSTMKQQK